MTPVAWFCSGFGMAVGMIVAVAVLVDIYFVEEQQTTISRRVLLASIRQPMVACVVALVLTAPVFMLLGHLLFGMTP